MSVIVKAAPAALVTAADAKGWAPVLADDSDARVSALLKAAQAAIEPPNGWVGRAFGMQTLEARLCGFGTCHLPLPFPPVREIVSVHYDDADGEEQDVPLDAVRLIGAGTATAFVRPKGAAAWPHRSAGPESVRVEFKAGYAADDPEVEPVRHAIVLGAVQLRSLTTQDLALRSRTIEGVGARTWTVSENAEKLVRSAVDALLSPFRIYRL